ncbi:HAMP domain-containing sensor histidine kinase [Streptomyces sp. H27-C3]|uniref:sensor histidine kinase n=1 Tax=Streptomyces sp. H27-C3 TaxID=3046305 RepID=UPI0024BA6D15|nr:HAMP domain-containing sensor histidine kinase [Streptomyces sp. H27-C3]MDJ0462294.1 HAMP domain-containing sensor histidine kinase [Streptomyces sp. H27-C3]
MRRLFGSVRARAAIGATLVVAVALVAAGLALLWVLRANLTDQTDLQAEVGAQDVASQVALGKAFKDLDLPDDRVVQVVSDGGRVLAVSEDLESVEGAGSSQVRVGGAEPVEDDGEDDPGRGEVSDDEPKLSGGSAVVDGEHADYRFAAVEATTPQGQTVTAYAGAPRSAEQGAVGSVTDAMLIGLPAMLVVVGGVTWLVTRRALRPVEGIRKEMSAITASEDLSRRVPEPDAHDEVARLARTTNETLGALEASVERQRRFVADASHELRSPIASLRTQLEVGSAHPELLDVEGAVRDTVRLQAVAADLLLLARLDAGERPGRAHVDVGLLVREEVSQRSDRLPVMVKVTDGLEVAGSRGQLARVLGNLLDNAQRHARGSVDVWVHGDLGDVLLRVADDGAGIPAAERERVFERFVRLDDARSRDEGGAGLGLAIARDVALRHGGTLTVSEGERGGALFALRLPAA